MQLEILYQDNHLFVVNKPAGMATQPSPTSNSSLEKFCKEWIKQEAGKPGEVFLHAIHRLDKPVSGIVLFAKTSKALSRLNEAMRTKSMHKVYTALVEGEIQKEEGELEHYLLHGDHYAHVVAASHPEAKKARLRYVVKERRPRQTLIEVHLDTGRYHQIRAQMAALNHPIVGDHKYGSLIPFQEGKIALCHTYFSFPHPISRKTLEFAVTPEFRPS